MLFGGILITSSSNGLVITITVVSAITEISISLIVTETVITVSQPNPMSVTLTSYVVDFWTTTVALLVLLPLIISSPVHS